MTNLRYRITEPAWNDLDDIGIHIAQDNPGAADRLADRFHRSFRMIAKHPRIGRPREELSPGLRGVSVGSYVVLYRLRGQQVEIVRIIHGARDLPEQFRRG